MLGTCNQQFICTFKFVINDRLKSVQNINIDL